MGDLSEHFSTSEMECHHCGRCSISGALITALEALRALGPEPIIVNDGYRCPEHNAAVGGVPDSEHVQGIAADIRIQGLSLQEMYDRAVRVQDFAEGGIGVYDGNFIHVDVRQRLARWARVDGKYVSLSTLVHVSQPPDLDGEISV
jgi:uncharacterized protein YcbK (DUF882 family)